MNAIATPTSAGWSAALELEFAQRGARTALIRNRHNGPLRVQRPFYPESAGQCHVYILHPPGGIVAGDTLAIKASVDASAHALLTTPSAGRVYKSNQQRLLQSQTVDLTVQAGGFCEWLPQENIVFNNAQARNHTQVNLIGDARFIGWDVTCLGRPAANELFAQGSLQQNLILNKNGEPLLIEKNRILGGSAMLDARWGLHGRTAFGTLVCTLHNSDFLAAAKQLCQQASAQHPPLRAAATQLPGLVVIRAMALQAEPIKNLFMPLWKQMRRVMLNQEPVAPRIWFT